MHIKQNKQFQFKINMYFSVDKNLDLSNQHPIIYVAWFFFEGFSYFYRSGVANCIKKITNHEIFGIRFEMVALDIDSKANLAYISEDWNNSKQEITPEIDQFIEDDNLIELCHRNFIGYAVMTEENLYHLLLTWEKLVEELVPFILIYQDDEGWYDSLGFETEEAMQQFVADHTKPE